MKKKYIKPISEYICPSYLMGKDGGNTGGGTPIPVSYQNPSTEHSGSKQNLVVWDDNFDEEDDTWGFNGF